MVMESVCKKPVGSRRPSPVDCEISLAEHGTGTQQSEVSPELAGESAQVRELEPDSRREVRAARIYGRNFLASRRTPAMLVSPVALRIVSNFASGENSGIGSGKFLFRVLPFFDGFFRLESARDHRVQVLPWDHLSKILNPRSRADNS
jgi:hypothetical protein